MRLRTHFPVGKVQDAPPQPFPGLDGIARRELMTLRFLPLTEPPVGAKYRKMILYIFHSQWIGRNSAAIGNTLCIKIHQGTSEFKICYVAVPIPVVDKLRP